MRTKKKNARIALGRQACQSTRPVFAIEEASPRSKVQADVSRLLREVVPMMGLMELGQIEGFAFHRGKPGLLLGSEHAD